GSGLAAVQASLSVPMPYWMVQQLQNGKKYVQFDDPKVDRQGVWSAGRRGRAGEGEEGAQPRAGSREREERSARGRSSMRQWIDVWDETGSRGAGEIRKGLWIDLPDSPAPC